MNIMICNNCQIPNVEHAKYCLECGNRLNSKTSQKPILKDIKLCPECTNKENKVQTINSTTLSYHKKGDEIKCDVILNDEVGKETMRILLQSLTQSFIPQTYPVGSNAKTIKSTRRHPRVKKSYLSSNPTPTKSIDLEEFDTVENENKPSLQSLYSIHQPKNNKGIFGMIAYYICIHNQSDSFTAGNIDYAFEILKIAKKNNLKQLIANVKNNTKYFDRAGLSSWKLTRLGEIELGKIYNN